jgi:hypothetical protein
VIVAVTNSKNGNDSVVRRSLAERHLGAVETESQDEVDRQAGDTGKLKKIYTI